MAAAPWLVTAIAFVHPSPLFEGAIELCLVLSFAFLLQQLLGAALSRVDGCEERAARSLTARSPQPKGGSCAEWHRREWRFEWRHGVETLCCTPGRASTASVEADSDAQDVTRPATATHLE